MQVELGDAEGGGVRRGEVVFATAHEIFGRLPPALQLATLSPDYVRADAARGGAAQPVYWLYEEPGAIWYHGFHLVPLSRDVPLPGDGPPSRDDPSSRSEPGSGGARFEIRSPYGYGGPLADSTDAGFLARAWAAYRQYATQRGVAAEFVRFHPLAANDRFYGGEVEENRETVWIDLSADLCAQYQTRVRTAIRKAEAAGIEFSWIDNDSIPVRFADFYRAGMTALGAAPFYFFSTEYFAALAADSAVRLGVCTRRGEWLSAALFLRGSRCMEYHLAATSSAGRSLGAGNLLLHAAAVAAKREGCHSLYLGGGTTPDADNPLLFYKAGFSKLRAPFKVGTFRHGQVRPAQPVTTVIAR